MYVICDHNQAIIRLASTFSFDEGDQLLADEFIYQGASQYTIYDLPAVPEAVESGSWAYNPYTGFYPYIPPMPPFIEPIVKPEERIALLEKELNKKSAEISAMQDAILMLMDLI